MSQVLLEDQYYVFWCCSRSGITATGMNPRVLVFMETSGTPLYTGVMDPIPEFTGVYRTNIPMLGIFGFVTGASYGVWATGVVSGGLPVRENIHRLETKSTLFNGLTGIANDLYHAQINHCYVKPSGLDRWTTLWFKNGVPYPTWSTGKLTVFNSSGNIYFGNSGLTAYGAGISGGQLTIGGTGILKSGERYLAQTTAFIDGTTRMWEEHVGYDI